MTAWVMCNRSDDTSLIAYLLFADRHKITSPFDVTWSGWQNSYARVLYSWFLCDFGVCPVPRVVSPSVCHLRRGDKLGRKVGVVSIFVAAFGDGLMLSIGHCGLIHRLGR